jgi:SMC interacting uncharacterized protein involved in chromosome segregation
MFKAIRERIGKLEKALALPTRDYMEMPRHYYERGTDKYEQAEEVERQGWFETFFRLHQRCQSQEEEIEDLRDELRDLKDLVRKHIDKTGHVVYYKTGDEPIILMQ